MYDYSLYHYNMWILKGYFSSGKINVYLKWVIYVVEM
jgi:hypothetical protein